MASRAATRQPDIPIAQPPEKLARRQRNVGARSRTPRLRTLGHYLDADSRVWNHVTASTLHFQIHDRRVVQPMTVTALAAACNKTRNLDFHRCTAVALPVRPTSVGRRRTDRRFDNLHDFQIVMNLLCSASTSGDVMCHLSGIVAETAVECCRPQPDRPPPPALP
jgi:hypothetical protein